MPLVDFQWMEEDSKISRYTWRSWYLQGRFPVLKLGRRILVDEADYRAFLEANRVAASTKKPLVGGCE